MKVLIITKNAWDDKIASGNTLSNLFKSWPDTQYFTIYCRDSVPDNKCCEIYYSISPVSIIKNLFTPGRIGNSFSLSGTINVNYKNSFEVSVKRVSKKHRLISTLLYDSLYSTRIWLNHKLKKFVHDVNPDLVFCFGVPDAFTYQMVKYVKGHLKCPVVAYYVDDHYFNRDSRWNVLHSLGKKRLRRIAEMADKRYAISQMMCNDYSKEMSLEFSLLFKGCEVKEVVHHGGNCIRIVYAGNLFYHRDIILSELASSIAVLNSKLDKKTHLDIYTSTPINEEMCVRLNIVDASTVHSAKPFEEIVQIMRCADIVLHVESFDAKQKDIVRYSFSTKITDCLQSGAMMLAIGPKDVASIDFVSNVPGAITITDLKELQKTLSLLIQDPDRINENALATNKYAKTYMSIENVRNQLQNDFVSLIKQS